MYPSKSLQIYEERINRALHYIDRSLDRDIRLEDLAREACFSSFYFHRIFTAIVGETPADYIRRIRLETAARLLWSAKSLSILDISLKCGFSSPSILSRNFKSRFGSSPAQWRKRKPSHEHDNEKTLPAGKLRKTVRGLRGVELQEVTQLRVVFIRHMKGYREIGDSFRKLGLWITAKKLAHKDGRFIGIYLDNPHITSLDKCRYYACYTVGAEVKGDGNIGALTIPGGLFVRLDYKGPGSGIGRIFHYFYFSWLPQSGLWPDDKTNYILFRNTPVRDGKVLDIAIFIGVRAL